MAQRLCKSRSQIHREALVEYVDARKPDAVTLALDEVVEEIGPVSDGWMAEAGRRGLERSEW